MHYNNLIKAVLLPLLVGLFAGIRSADAQVCERFENLSSEEMARMLAGPDRTDGECVAFLLKRLGEARYKQASYTIATYLDFEWPKKKTGAAPAVMRLPALEDHYPAAGALFAIGTAAVPDITRFLSGGNVPPIAHENAVDTLLMIYRENQVQAVRTLIKASRTSPDPSEAVRLWGAAIDASRRCSLLRSACQAALLDAADR